MTLWHIILSIGVIAIAAIIGCAISAARRKKSDDRLNRGVTFDQPQQEGTERPSRLANYRPLVKDRRARL